LNFATATEKQLELLRAIADFAKKSAELETQYAEGASLRIRQRVDDHALLVEAHKLQDILMRTDTDGRDFVQVNFQDGTKILVTERLIGFKPVLRRASVANLAKLPRVVTTPDLVSVLEALEDAAEVADRDLSMLRELFDSILCGAEKVGFDVAKERVWLLPYLSTSPGLRANA
jgi:hypothetical protein